MYEIGSGIRVYFENRKEFCNVVFFPDDTCTYYPTGGILFELIRDDAVYMVTTKVKNMIRAFPDCNAEASAENVTNGFRWLYGTIEDEELPAVTELFRGCFRYPKVWKHLGGRRTSSDKVYPFGHPVTYTPFGGRRTSSDKVYFNIA